MVIEQLTDDDREALVSSIRMAAAEAAVVHRDAAAMQHKMGEVGSAAAARDADGQEAAAFLEWARAGGFEVFGYAHYEVQAGQRELVREADTALGVLADRSHPVYGTCLAGIPGDFETLAARKETLSVVKADTQSTLHRDQQLDFIGVRDTDERGTILGEYCFVGLFSRAATASNLQQMPFARGKIDLRALSAGLRPGYRTVTHHRDGRRFRCTAARLRRLGGEGGGSLDARPFLSLQQALRCRFRWAGETHPERTRTALPAFRRGGSRTLGERYAWGAARVAVQSDRHLDPARGIAAYRIHGARKKRFYHR